MSLYAVTTQESMIATFLIKLAALNTDPTLALLLGCRRHLNLCAISLPLRGNLVGHLHLAVPQPLYAIETSNLYSGRQVDPGDTVTYTPAAGIITRANDDNLYGLKSKKIADYNLLYAFLIKRLHDMLGTHV